MSTTSTTSSSPATKLDLVFLMDCTGSMGSYIDAAKRSIQDIITKIIRSEKTEVRFGLIAYRDHPPQDNTFVTKTHAFTSSSSVMQTYLDGLSASGGGDGPEAVTAAMAALLPLDWHESAAKVVVLIADAPPHGLGESGDGFPNGDPDGHDPIAIARQLASRGIVIYSVGCEPALGQYMNARGFFVAISQITEGQAIALSSSALLADVILGGSLEEIGLQTVANQYEDQMAEIIAEHREAGQDVASEAVSADIAQKLQLRMRAANCQVSSMQTDGKMTDARSDHYTKNKSLSEATAAIAKEYGSAQPASAPIFDSVFGGGIRRCLSSASPMAPPSSMAVPASSGGAFGYSGSSATTCTIRKEDISLEQCSRLVQRSLKKAH